MYWATYVCPSFTYTELLLHLLEPDDLLSPPTFWGSTRTVFTTVHHREVKRRFPRIGFLWKCVVLVIHSDAVTLPRYCCEGELKENKIRVGKLRRLSSYHVLPSSLTWSAHIRISKVRLVQLEKATRNMLQNLWSSLQAAEKKEWRERKENNAFTT